MKHCFVDTQSILLPLWREAFPEAVLIQRGRPHSVRLGDARIIWLRIRAGEDLQRAMAFVTLDAGQSLVILSDAPDEELVMQALSLGGSGCCNAYAAPEVLRQVALVVENGGLWVGQSLLQRLVGATSRALATGQKSAQQGNDWLRSLTEREVEVARLVAGGSSNREVAEQLAVTERTVKAHLTTIFEKLAIRDRLQLSLKVNGLNS